MEFLASDYTTLRANGSRNEALAGQSLWTSTKVSLSSQSLGRLLGPTFGADFMRTTLGGVLGRSLGQSLWAVFGRSLWAESWPDFWAGLLGRTFGPDFWAGLLGRVRWPQRDIDLRNKT